MKDRIGRAARIAAGLLLFVLSIRAMQTPGPVRWLAAAEAAAALAFCMPRIWRAGAAVLLVILAVAVAHHAIDGQFAPGLVFAVLAVTMALAHERS